MRGLLNTLGCAALAVATVLAVASCDQPTAAPSGRVPLAFQASLVPPDVGLILVEVTGAGIPVPIRGNYEVVQGSAHGTLEVPVGADRVFTARGFDREGRITHEGSVVRDVRPNGPPVNIPLLPRGVGVEVVVSLGRYSVALQPQSVELHVGETVALTATVLDAAGAVIAHAEVTWGSSNPALAVVDGKGFVTALHPGTLRIVANHQGTAAQAELIVRAAPTNTAPVAAITAPANGASVPVGSVVQLMGVAEDAEDGMLDGAALVWSSSLDGQLGTGASISRSNLSLGEHSITLTATDTDGMRGSAQIQLTVEPLPTMRWVVTGPLSSGTWASPNGTEWTRTSAFEGRAAAWNGSQWLVGSESGGSINRSVDARTWASAASGLSNVYGLAWFEPVQRWVAAGTGIAVSANGQNWTTHPLPLDFAEAVACNAVRCVAVGWGGTGIATSTDGSTWTATQTPYTGTVIRVKVVAWNGAYWLAAAIDGRGIVRSEDGVTWTAVPGTTSMSPYSIGWNGSEWLIGEMYNRLWSSSDGVNWSVRAGPFVGAISQDQLIIYGIVHDGAQWLLAARSRDNLHQHVAVSADGVSWTRSLGGTYGFQAAAWGGR